MSKKLKKNLIRISISLVVFLGLFVAGHIISEFEATIYGMLLYLALYIYIGGDVVKKAFRNIIHGKAMDENFLMTLATAGAFLINEPSEGVAVMLFYQVGEWFQNYAVNRSRSSIKDLMNIRPDFANVIRDGVEEVVDPDEVSIGEIILVKPGEKIPLDGSIIEGSTSIDTMALTGESVPREVVEGEQVISGCINLTKAVRVRVEKEFGESTVSKILDLVENATSQKAQTENFISKFARYYTPIIVALAVLVSVIPPLVFKQPFTDWLYRGLSFLVISCPCALVISIPLGFFGGIGGASKSGILVKGSSYLELLSKAEMVVMDKTGTLTKGVFEVQQIVPANGIDEKVLLEKTAIAESYSTHPISKSLKKAYGKEIDRSRLGDVEEIAGHGIATYVDGVRLYVGNDKLMSSRGISYPEVEAIGTVVYVADENSYLGYILIADEEKDDAKKCVSELYKNGVRKVVMLTGDRAGAAKYIADKLGIKDYYSDLLPGDKVDRVEELFAEKSESGKLVFVGDGINDAPVLARADIGIAMGGLGSDAAIEAADVVIMTDEPAKIALAMKISRRTLRIVNQNIVFAIAVKVLVLVLAALGVATMWAAVFADVGVAFLAILNSMRALNVTGLDK